MSLLGTEFGQLERITKKLSFLIDVSFSHQKKALSMMLEKESGRLENAEFNPMWRIIRAKDGQKRYNSIPTSILPRC